MAEMRDDITPITRRFTNHSRLQDITAALQIVGAALLLSSCNVENLSAQNQTHPVTSADAVRFLEQSSWGPTEASIQDLQDKGIEKFIDEQFAATPSTLGSYSQVDLTDQSEVCPAEADNHAICLRDNYSIFPLQKEFFHNALNGQDQLRQRVAFALSQILVVSGLKVDLPYAMAAYQELLAKHAFGNFRDILFEITLSPAMGRYLDMVNNIKPDPIRGVAPNENYARELLQLFSIGVFELNNDGSLKMDGDGQPIPAYDEETIEGFAHTFTGWTYPTRPGNNMKALNPTFFTGQMVVDAGKHDTNAKKLLDGVVLPTQQTAKKDIDDAIDNVFSHPNVGPFICKQLIQHLVTSNPSPEYVDRIANVFNNNGRGVRGDMKAVIKAILLDSEARGDAKTEPEYGKLREPVKFISGIVRALGGQSDGVYLRAQSAALGQDVYQAPSVFNFYPPDYPLPGTDLVSPASSIYTATTVLSRANFVYTLLFSDGGIAPDPTVHGATGTTIDLSSLTALANDPERLMDKLDLVMMHENMSHTMRNIVIQTINALPANDPLARVRTAVYLIATSPQYQAER